MVIRPAFVPALGMIVVLATCIAACSGGGSHAVPALPSPSTPLVTPASGTVVITVPAANAFVSSSARTPAYVSASTKHAAVFICPTSGCTTQTNSGSTTSAPSCSGVPVTCTLTISWSADLAVPQSYEFAVETDTGSSGSPANTVLAESQAAYVIHAGVNSPGTLTLNGVAAKATISGEGCDNNSPSTSAATCAGTLTIEDAAGDTITTPGANLDNAPLTLVSSNTAVGKVTTGTFSAMNATGTYSYTFTCQTNTNTFTISATSGSGSGAVSATELAAIGVSYPSSSVPITWNATGLTTSTYICRTGNAMKKAFFLPPSGTFALPSDWNNANNSIETIGGGGNGAGNAQDAGVDGGGGGGGGGYSILVNTVHLTLANSPYTYKIGSGGTQPGDDTYFCGPATLGACSDSGGGVFGAGVLVAARGGVDATTDTAGAGGAATTVGTTEYAGGAGGAGRANSSRAGGGGGSAAGDLGAGKVGGATQAAAGNGGGGGAGADNGVAGTASTSATGGAGGASGPGGAGGAAGAAGTNGGGGGGGNGGAAPTAGGAGGSGSEWDSSHGSGGGGGGGGGGTGAAAVANGGNGGGYGGGGGGAGNNSAKTLAGTGGQGSAGLIVVIYAP